MFILPSSRPYVYICLISKETESSSNFTNVLISPSGYFHIGCPRNRPYSYQRLVLQGKYEVYALYNRFKHCMCMTPSFYIHQVRRYQYLLLLNTKHNFCFAVGLSSNRTNAQLLATVYLLFKFEHR